MLRKLCALDFDAPPAPAAGTEVPPSPAYGEDDLAAMRDEAFARGRAEAFAEAAAATDAALAAAMGTLASAIRAAGDEAGRLNEAAAGETARLLAAMLGALLPTAAQALGEKEVVGLAAEILPALPSEPRITVQVAPALAGSLSDRLDLLAPAVAPRVTIEASPAVPYGDIRFAWSAGQASRTLEDSWASVLRVLSPLGLSPHPSPGEPVPAGAQARPPCAADEGDHEP